MNISSPDIHLPIEVLHHDRESIRTAERLSIRTFVEKNADSFGDRILDFGAGSQPYLNLMPPTATITPFQKGDVWADLLSSRFETILCTQVFQYLDSPEDTLWHFRRILVPGGTLILTYATNWEELETEDHWRFTKAGMEELLHRTGTWKIVEHVRRAEIKLGAFKLALGYGLVAKVWEVE